MNMSTVIMSEPQPEPVGSFRRLLISDLCNLIEEYLEPEQAKKVYRAYLFSSEAHTGQQRLSGEPYIYHPIAVAYILGEMRVDAETLCAALLHDVIEDTGISKERLAYEFGDKVAELVDGVSKLTMMECGSREQAQAATFRKMVLAMNRDIRVILVKLADRLHNMRTLGVMKPEAQRRIARETLEIYAPLAGRLGMNSARIELEELSFAALYPRRYQVISERMRQVREKRGENVKTIRETIQKRLDELGLNAQVHKLKRHNYSIYRRIRERKSASSSDKRKSFAKVSKIYTFWVIVDTVDTCYRVLGVLHSLYKPIDEKFKDYVAIPKMNGHQSLGTVLFTPYGVPMEVQIRTATMHELSQYGITAYGLYKFDNLPDNLAEPANYATRQRAGEWLRSLVDMQNSSGDSLEFLEHVKRHLFPDEVYVFTPKGQILQLPKGATAVDFAYAVHADVGNKCIAAKIDNVYAPLSTPIISGQTVEVLTAAWARPNPSWLDFAVSGRARSHIRNFFKNLTNDQAVSLGKRLLDNELTTYGLSVDSLTIEQRESLARVFKVEKLETLLADIGLGNRVALVVAQQFDPTPEDRLTASKNCTSSGLAKPLFIRGTENILIEFSRCCRPIPGDEIVGVVNTGYGLVIHTANCRHVSSYRNQSERLLPVEWEPGIDGEFLVDIRIEVHNQRGVLAGITTAISNMDINIENVSNENRDGLTSILHFTVQIRGRSHLADVIRHLRRIDSVIRIQRNKS